MANPQELEDRAKRKAGAETWATALGVGVPLHPQQIAMLELLLEYEKGQQR